MIKKLTVTVFAAVFALSISAGVFAQNPHANSGQGLGLTVGAEFGIDDFGDASNSAYLRPLLRYDNNARFNGALGISAEIGVPFWSNPEPWMGVDLSLRGMYRFNPTPEGTLGFFLQSQTAFIGVDGGGRGASFPRFGWTGGRPLRDITSVLTPGFRYTHALGNISVFAQVDSAFLLFAGGDRNFFDWADIEFTLGMRTRTGFAIEFEIEHWIRHPRTGNAELFYYLTITSSYRTGPIFAEIDIGIPLDDFDDGLRITPEVRYQILDNLQVFTNLTFDGVGGGDDTRVGMGFGVMFSF